MGRELRRKEEKKNKNRVINKEEKLDTSIKLSTIIKTTLIVGLLLVAIWYIIAIFVTKEIRITTKEDTTTTKTETTDNITNKILASATFNQKEEKYYVYYYDFRKEDTNIANSIQQRTDLKIYRVDTSSSLNQKYVTEENGNNLANSLDNLKVKNPTLLEITNDQITGYYEGNINIGAFLNQ